MRSPWRNPMTPPPRGGCLLSAAQRVVGYDVPAFSSWHSGLEIPALPPRLQSARTFWKAEKPSSRDTLCGLGRVYACVGDPLGGLGGTQWPGCPAPPMQPLHSGAVLLLAHNGKYGGPPSPGSRQGVTVPSSQLISCLQPGGWEQGGRLEPRELGGERSGPARSGEEKQGGQEGWC